MICPNRYSMHLSSSGGACAQMLQDPNGMWVPIDVHEAALMAVDANRNLVKQLKDQRAALQAENERLRVAVEWYKQADRLICWNGTEWEVRHELKEGR